VLEETQANPPHRTKRILIAVDNSPRAGNVFDVGAEYAGLLRAELYLFRAISVPQEFPPGAVSSENDPLPRQLTEIALQQLTVIASRIPSVTVTHMLVRVGFPDNLILETAEALDADLIVLGSHGYSGWDRILGTTAAAIANRSTRNVLIVHAKDALEIP